MMVFLQRQQARRGAGGSVAGLRPGGDMPQGEWDLLLGGTLPLLAL